MPEPITNDLIPEVRAALAKATPGPWWWRNTQNPMLLGGRSKLVMSFERMGMQGAQPMFRDEHNIMQPGGRANLNEFPDAHLIANAPAWLEALCDEVERLRREWKELADELEVVQSDRTEEWARAEKAEAALERVRALALGEDGEEWVRAAGPLGTVARSAILAALDGE